MKRKALHQGLNAEAKTCPEDAMRGRFAVVRAVCKLILELCGAWVRWHVVFDLLMLMDASRHNAAELTPMHGFCR